METDILNHLINIENSAATILLDAQIEADRRTAEARLKADNEYKMQYEKLILELEKSCQSKIDIDEKEHTVALATFKKELDSSKKDIAAFNSLVDTLFFEK